MRRFGERRLQGWLLQRVIIQRRFVAGGRRTAAIKRSLMLFPARHCLNLYHKIHPAPPPVRLQGCVCSWCRCTDAHGFTRMGMYGRLPKRRLYDRSCTVVSRSDLNGTRSSADVIYPLLQRAAVNAALRRAPATRMVAAASDHTTALWQAPVQARLTIIRIPTITTCTSITCASTHNSQLTTGRRRRPGKRPYMRRSLTAR